MTGSDDDDAEDTPDQNQDEAPETSQDNPDTGATLTAAPDGTVDIDVGEDETRDLVAFAYVDGNDHGGAAEVDTYEIRFYLVKDSSALPQNTVDSDFNYPGSDGSVQTIEEMEQAAGLELVGTIALDEAMLNARLPYTDNADESYVFELMEGQVAEDFPDIEANCPFDTYLLIGQTNGPYIADFIPEVYTVPEPDPLEFEVVYEGADAILTENQDGTLSVALADGVSGKLILIDHVFSDSLAETTYYLESSVRL